MNTEDMLSLFALTALALPGTAKPVVMYPSVEIHRGIFQHGFEVSTFTPCGSKESWWVVEVPESVREFNNKTLGDSVYVEWRGEVSNRGIFGHFGMYARQFRPSKVVLQREGTCYGYR